MNSLILGLLTLAACSSAQRKYYSLHNMPETNFDCRDKILGGYYADPEVNCQMFHVCVKIPGQGIQDFRFLCPNETVFDQENQICADSGDIDCEASGLYLENFDLYRIGRAPPKKPTVASSKGTPIPLGPSTKSPILTNNINEDDDFYLQRSESGDRRSHGKDLLRGSSSSNFFNNRNNGKDLDDDEDTNQRTQNEQRQYKKTSQPVRGKNQYSSQIKKVTTPDASTTSNQPPSTPVPNRPIQPQVSSQNYPRPQNTQAPVRHIQGGNFVRQQTSNHQPSTQQPNFNRQPAQSQPSTSQQPNFNRQPAQNHQPSTQQPNFNRQPAQSQPSTQQPNFNRQPAESQPSTQPNFNRQPAQSQPSTQQPNFNRQPAQSQPSTQQPNFNRQPAQSQPSTQQPNFNRQPAQNYQQNTQQPRQNFQQTPQQTNFNTQTQNYPSSTQQPFQKQNFYRQPSTFQPINVPPQPQSTTNDPQNFESFDKKRKIAVRKLARKRTSPEPTEDKYTTANFVKSTVPPNSFTTQVSNKFNFGTNEQKYNTIQRQPTTNFPSTPKQPVTSQKQYQPSTFQNYQQTNHQSTNFPSTSKQPTNYQFNQQSTNFPVTPKYKQQSQSTAAFFEPSQNKNYDAQDDFDDIDKQEFLKTAQSNNYRPSNLNSFQNNYKQTQYNEKLANKTETTTQKSNYYTPTIYTTRSQFVQTEHTTKNIYYSPTVSTTSKSNYISPSSTLQPSFNSYSTTVNQPRPFSTSPVLSSTIKPSTASKKAEANQKDNNYDYAYYDDAGAFSEYDALDALGETDFTRTSKRTKSRLI